MTLAVLTMVRDAAPWLEQTLPVWSEISDGIVALDDNSTDDTAAMLADAGAEVHSNPSDDPAWGNESGPRALLFQKFQESDYEYGFVLDADMIPARDPRPLIAGGFINAVAFYLYDMWDAEHYRDDGYWFGHRYPRVWVVKKPPERFEADWSEKVIHCGHFPRNLGLTRTAFAPRDYSLLHYAYQTPELRDRKIQQYLEVREHLSEHEAAHAASIGDESPCLSRLPFTPQWQLDFSSAPVLA